MDRREERNRATKGTILIMALWTLGFLSVLAVTLGANVRQKIIFLKRIEDRSRQHLITASGVYKAVALLNQIKETEALVSTAKEKQLLLNNPEDFMRLIFPRGTGSVCHRGRGAVGNRKEFVYGLEDESGKVNINTANLAMLQALITYVFKWDAGRAKELAEAIIDWREYGETELKGFYSEDYYSNLQYPYPVKNEKFELIDELKLVKNINTDIFNRLAPYVTVYGDGQINVNTASFPVLMSLGLSKEVVDGILLTRRGPDGKEATLDDFIFQDVLKVPTEINKTFSISPNEAEQIYKLIDRHLLTTKSDFYYIESRTQLTQENAPYIIRCVYNTKEKTIEYWQEGF